MSGVNQILGADGAGTLVESTGKTWRFLPITQKIKAEFEAHLQFQARRSVLSMAEHLSAEELRMNLSVINADIGAGIYSWLGASCRQSLNDLPGIQKMAHLLIRQAHPEVTDDQIGEVFLGNMQGVTQVVMDSCDVKLPDSEGQADPLPPPATSPQ